jgi:hypothetical protein
LSIVQIEFKSECERDFRAEIIRRLLFFIRRARPFLDKINSEERGLPAEMQMSRTSMYNVAARASRSLDPTSDSTTTDGGLLTHFIQTGDETAFAELVRRHGPMVLGDDVVSGQRPDRRF